MHLLNHCRRRCCMLPLLLRNPHNNNHTTHLKKLLVSLLFFSQSHNLPHTSFFLNRFNLPVIIPLTTGAPPCARINIHLQPLALIMRVFFS
jgi:hypothetical protein